jgi:hypothetical protein
MNTNNPKLIERYAENRSETERQVVALFEENTVADEKASVIVGGNKYTSTTRQVEYFGHVFMEYTVKKNGVPLCLSQYDDDNRETIRTWGAKQ